MSIPFFDYLDNSAYSPWNDGSGIISLSGDALLPESCYFPEERIPHRNASQFFDYRFELTMDAENMIRELLGFLVDYRQKRKLTLFFIRTGESLQGGPGCGRRIRIPRAVSPRDRCAHWGRG